MIFGDAMNTDSVQPAQKVHPERLSTGEIKRLCAENNLPQLNTTRRQLCEKLGLKNDNNHVAWKSASAEQTTRALVNHGVNGGNTQQHSRPSISDDGPGDDETSISPYNPFNWPGPVMRWMGMHIQPSAVSDIMRFIPPSLEKTTCDYQVFNAPNMYASLLWQSWNIWFSVACFLFGLFSIFVCLLSNRDGTGSIGQGETPELVQFIQGLLNSNSGNWGYYTILVCLVCSAPIVFCIVLFLYTGAFLSVHTNFHAKHFCLMCASILSMLVTVPAMNLLDVPGIRVTIGPNVASYALCKQSEFDRSKPVHLIFEQENVTWEGTPQWEIRDFKTSPWECLSLEASEQCEDNFCVDKESTFAVQFPDDQTLQVSIWKDEKCDYGTKPDCIVGGLMTPKDALTTTYLRRVVGKSPNDVDNSWTMYALKHITVFLSGNDATQDSIQYTMWTGQTAQQWGEDFCVYCSLCVTVFYLWSSYSYDVSNEQDANKSIFRKFLEDDMVGVREACVIVTVALIMDQLDFQARVGVVPLTYMVYALGVAVYLLPPLVRDFYLYR